ncbi:MAG: GNAT family N-acetyltransferase [Methanobrevibacter sp.]|uniref:GNAT family N-acetyltransferase n=1 Tax=Methanobrevibacter sp. TaxID=66852 RepID=UPI001B68B3E5|nr:GNAT family N-acetyltransferase [Methanobrevibacter sp.]MBP3791634.1 GNAT family N-acetyltransferase [Methanobrevibacter sp.]
MNIIEKDTNAQRVFLSENSIDVVEILQNHYPYICDSIKKEEFILKYHECNLFKELVFDNKVVGFCTYDFSREFITAALNNIYVLPEYRGNGLFLSEILKTMEEHNKPSIMEPTRLVVELLIKYGFASKINDDIVASALEFVVPGDHVLSNTDYDNEELSTHFYDLSVCSSIHILDANKKHIAYSAPLNYDIMHYGCLKEIDGEYIDGIIEFFGDNDVEIMNSVLKLEENLPIKNYTLEEVIGDDDNFSVYIESLIDDAHVTHSKALEIKQQIKEEYGAGMILNESLMIRLAYLFNENPLPSITSHEETCPYCNMPIDDHDRFCHFCGINLEYDPNKMEEYLFNSLNTHKSEFEEDIRFVAYKFLKLIEEKIELEYSIYTIENNYNVNWKTLNVFLMKNNYFVDNDITDEGHEFLDNHPLNFWEKYHMDIVDYTDFENYFYEHADLNPIEICLNYLKQFDDDEFILEIMQNIENN